MSDNDTCLIWGTPAKRRDHFSRERVCVHSPRAGGAYLVDASAALAMSKLNTREKARLTTWLIEQRSLGVEQPELPSSDEIDPIVQRSDLTIHARADALLKYISTKTSDIGQKYEFWIGNVYDNEMELLAYTESVHHWEWEYLLDYLVRQGWLEKREIGEFDDPDSECHSEFTCLTVEGYAHLAELESPVIDSSRAFVAMWLDDAVKEAYSQGIEPAIRNAGYDPIRIDSQEYIGKIDDEIIAEIKRSCFLVADFTQKDDKARGSVYYEAGFAHGLGIPVIFTCRKDVIDRNLIHFDVRQQNFIVWENHKDLKERLTNRIAAVIGDGPAK